MSRQVSVLISRFSLSSSLEKLNHNITRRILQEKYDGKGDSGAEI